MPDAERYIHPQKKYADLSITYYDATLTDCWDVQHEEKLSLKITVSAEVNLETMIQELETLGVSVRYDYDEELQNQTVYFEGDKMTDSSFPLTDIAEKIIPQVDDIAILPLASTDYFHGVLELVILMLISHKMRNAGRGYV